jgi:hypothetical protein
MSEAMDAQQLLARMQPCQDAIADTVCLQPVLLEQLLAG